MQAFPFDSQLTFDSDNNPIYDRAISSQPLRKLIRDLFTTGVMPNPSTNLQVSAGTDGMTVQVAAGFAVIDGGLCQETETRTLEVTAADETYDRIDTVVLRWNENVDVRTADLYIIAGTPSASPVRPTLQRDNSIYEIGLADIFITRRIATVTNDKITDTRYETSRCGIVSSVSEWDTTTIYQQVQADLAGFKSEEQAEFLAWFETIQDILDENVAAHLQSEIDAINNTLDNLSAATVSFDDTTAQIGSNNVQGAIEGLKSAFSSALTSLKATEIAQAVGATGNTFTAVIQKLGTIVARKLHPTTRWEPNNPRPITDLNLGARGTCQDGTIRSVFEIPSGYYQNATDLVGVTDAKIRQLGWRMENVNLQVAYFSQNTGGNYDLGVANDYRYVNVNVDTHALAGAQLLGTSSGNYAYDNNSVYVVCAGSGSAGITINTDIFFRGQFLLKEAPDYLTTISVSGNTLVVGGSATWRRVYKVY